ncbi:SEC10/PgrA surface exclusion domain-containing protein [Lactobacillus sp. ESL0228]|uniref:SEC10/PgrA surface exclusion domain-containing protein n=1 Tax=Lactobacillus sp. ESL0228 TaxID=2069352 RepID=UPI000EFBAB1E|nr:SEC10/PgrA surface exclusion domain-containing protein [Lactobacillus sp. ESL0228]RMC50967.1 SEC10/PgrA surface exclusion domain-containing protein [Lactobacillus sp. ESL0228]
MNKSKIMLAITNVFLCMTILQIMVNQSQQVHAVTVKGYVVVKSKKKPRLYNESGKITGSYASAKTSYPYSIKKRIGKKKILAYKIGNNSHWILAKDVKQKRKQSSPIYIKAKLNLPSGYTKAEVLRAYQGKPSKAFINASMRGMKVNDFSRVKSSESKTDDLIQVNLDAITSDQIKSLTEFSLRLINDARSDLGLMPWVNSIGTSKLAQDIAVEYARNNQTIRNSHYIPGIVRACKTNGLNLDNNYVEDMAGFYNPTQTMTMTQLKKSIYFGLKQMLFGYTGSGEDGRNNRNYYQEWDHAGDLLNTQGSLHDGDYNYFGFSISHTSNICSLHFISVPTYVVKSKKYNIGFQP